MAITKRHKDKDLPSQREWQERTRQKIRDRKIIEKACDVVDGKIKMDSGQIAVLKTLIPAVLPMQTENTEHQGEPVKPDLNALREAIANSPELQAMVVGLIDPAVLASLIKSVPVTKEMQEAQSIPLKH